jgi:hypothetical protein
MSVSLHSFLSPERTMLGIVIPGLRWRSLQSNSKFERMFQLDVQRKGRVSTHEAHEGRFTYALTPSMKCRTLTTVTIKRDEYYKSHLKDGLTEIYDCVDLGSVHLM